MRTLLTALLLTTGVYACASDKPAESPSTGTTTSTSSTSSMPSTSSSMPATNTPSTSGTAAATTGDTTMPSNSMPATNAPGAVPPAPAMPDNSKNADNTKQNERDRNSGALTPMDQGGGKDRDITAAIRRSVVGDGSLSFDAKNVKIITVGGKVTLRGPVKSDAEKTAIEAKSKAVTGVTSVDNQLDVKK